MLKTNTINYNPIKPLNPISKIKYNISNKTCCNIIILFFKLLYNIFKKK